MKIIFEKGCWFKRVIDTFIYSIPPGEMARLLTKMCLESTPFDSGNKIMVEVPPTRHDILP